ncbi:MAG TPA: cupin domain-containing protein [Opitutaceae bacterium]|nr:cupin domain-containing protein [Opitutaceae bacterium]
MNRRRFIAGPVALGALAVLARGASDSGTKAERCRAFRVGANEDRHGEELLIMGGRFDLKVSAQDSGGDLCIYDTYRSSKGGPALHVHHVQDEWFYVLQGEFIVRVGEDIVKVGPGDSAFAPRKVSHTFAMVSEGVGQMLVLFQPAGTMEEFFRQMAQLGREIPKNMEIELKKLFEAHGMDIVGPPLKI